MTVREEVLSLIEARLVEQRSGTVTVVRDRAEAILGDLLSAEGKPLLIQLLGPEVIDLAATSEDVRPKLEDDE